ncbi:hypothetical protein ACWEQ3_01435 [Streptomyces mirabilis]
MALYSVERTDDTKPGEFVNALVVARGAALARKAVSHLGGVTAKNIKASLVPNAPQGGAVLLAAYWDERDQEESLF